MLEVFSSGLSVPFIIYLVHYNDWDAFLSKYSLSLSFRFLLHYSYKYNVYYILTYMYIYIKLVMQFDLFSHIQEFYQ